METQPCIKLLKDKLERKIGWKHIYRLIFLRYIYTSSLKVTIIKIMFDTNIGLSYFKSTT